jgi:3-oxoacyl-[acyl-carrier protein] reductase
MVSATVATFGGLDLLVNNAGTAQPGELSTTSTDDIAAMVDVNLKGTLYVTRAAIGPLTERRGRIVNIGSVGGIGASRVSSVYGATKAAVHHLTTCLARELAPRGIAVNTIVPGPVQTEIIDARLMKRLAASTLLGRVGQPEDVATWIVALAAPDADWVTGAQLTVDGGFSIGP